MKRLFSLILLASLSVACSKKEEPKEEPTAAEQPPAEKPKKERPIRVSALAPDEPRTRIKDLPTSVDLEEEASRTVAVENLEAELDRLEAEIVSQPE